MSREIHIIIKDGRAYYLEWSNVVQAYTTTPTTNLLAFKELLLNTELEKCRARFEEEWPRRIQRALAAGTSQHGAPEAGPYTTLVTESSFCPQCDQPVLLLSNGDSPQFYLCWDCQWIGEVGIGTVRPLESREES